MFNLFAAGRNILRVERTRLRRRRIEQDRRDRIARHKQAVAARKAEFAARPDTTRSLILFADGDSWFDYPLPILAANDVITSIGNHGTPQPLILNLAHFGDEARNLLGVQQRERIITNLKDAENGAFDAILFSAGGNDTVGNPFCLWIKNFAPGMTPSEGINQPRLDAVLDVVRSAHEDLISVRNQFAPHALLFFHAYDFAIPNGEGVFDDLIGPWLKPSLDFRDWRQLPAAAEVVRQFLLGFREMLVKIAASHDGVVFVETQGTLAPDDWANELHPTPTGFDKIGAKFLDALRKTFPGRI